MYYEPNLWRHTTCAVCGRGFMDDCGSDICSSECEREYERQNAECDLCGQVVGEDNLNSVGICEYCENEEEDGS